MWFYEVQLCRSIRLDEPNGMCRPILRSVASDSASNGGLGLGRCGTRLYFALFARLKGKGKTNANGLIHDQRQNSLSPTIRFEHERGRVVTNPKLWPERRDRDARPRAEGPSRSPLGAPWKNNIAVTAPEPPPPPPPALPLGPLPPPAAATATWGKNSSLRLLSGSWRAIRHCGLG